MADKKIKFRGKQVNLKFTLLSLRKLEDAGVSLSQLSEGTDVSIDILGKMLWAGLLVDFPDATEDEVLGSYEIHELQDVSDALNAALNKATKK